MLSNFIKKVKKERTIKAFNIDNIREIIESKAPSRELTHELDSMNVNKEIKLTANKIVKREIDGTSGDKRRNTLEAYNFMSDLSFIVGDEVIVETGESGARYNKSGDLSEGDAVLSADPRIAAEERKVKVMNFSRQHIQLEYTPSNAALYLPKGFRMISELYKIITVMHNFNKKRNLSLILIKHKESIERLFKHRVEIKHLEQLNYIACDAIRFIPLQVVDEGVKIDTFKIDILQSFDVDFALFNCFNEIYKRWLFLFILNGGQGNKNAGDDADCINTELLDSKERMQFDFFLGKIHPDFVPDEVAVPVKPFFTKESVAHRDAGLKKVAKEKTGAILDRIREKERLRREAFVQEQTVNKDYSVKLANLFKIGNKMAIKLDEAVFKIGGFDCKSQILKILSPKYAIKEINEVEYIVKHG